MIVGGALMAGGENTEFIRSVRYSMIDRDIDNAAELHKLMKEKVMGGDIASRATIYGYFNGSITPQPWFLRALEETYEAIGKPLSEEELQRLQGTYIASY